MKYGDLIQFKPIESVVQLRTPTKPLRPAACRDLRHFRGYGGKTYGFGYTSVTIRAAY